MDGVDSTVQLQGGSEWRLVRGSGPAGPGAAFAEAYHRQRQTVQVWLTDAALRELAELLEQELSRRPSGSDDVERLAACLLDLQQRGGLSGWQTLTRGCELGGIAYDRLLVEADGSAELYDRWCPIRHDELSDGTARSIGVKFHPPRSGEKRRFRPFGVGFRETYLPPEDESRPYEYGVETAYPSLAALLQGLVPGAVAPGESREAEDMLVAQLAALVGREIGDGAAAPGRLRDLVAAHCRELDVAYELVGLTRRITLLDVPDPDAGTAFVLALSIDANRPVPEVTFTEATQRLHRNGRRNEYALALPTSAVPQAVAHLTGRFPAQAPAELPEDPAEQLAAWLTALAAAGPLGPGRAQRAVRDEVASWLAEAGVPHTVRNHRRDEPLLEVWRESSGSAYTLRLRLDPQDAAVGVVFSEEYDYVSRGGLGGREDSYTARCPYASLGALVAYFEARGAGTPHPAGDLEDRLAAALTALVDAGELDAAAPIAANRDRVAGWFAEAGVPVTTDHWAWVSMD
ncbi:hypothetical protein [Catellatospora sp. NPDC049609]|uniref:hypothetical protein n=1 Tax=Catellatospora sp. NPDC049609 TaxID=3155505 RepID=UPI00342379F7